MSYETSPQDDPTKVYMDIPISDIWRYGVGATYRVNDNWQVRGYYDYIDLGTPNTITHWPQSLGNLNGQLCQELCTLLWPTSELSLQVTFSLDQHSPDKN
ncbi:hypothetical protein O9993_12410 [Vibrio lentus]|nr:hypothetical protein [Vibrio lentus]